MTYEEAKQKKEEAYKTWREKTIKIEETWDYNKTYNEYHHAVYENKEYNTYKYYSNIEEKLRPIEYRDPKKREFKCRMTTPDFVDACKSGYITDWDGSGEYGLKDKISNISVDCSEIARGNIRTGFTHVWWYNK